MPFSKEKLLELNSRGIIPGPEESLDEFKSRVDSITDIQKKGCIIKKEALSWHDFDWARSTMCQLFDISPDWVYAYYSNKGLKFWQGAVTLISTDKRPFLALQIRKQLKSGKYLFLYEKDEILSHELSHAARMAFDEPKTEELFAYWTSTSHFRKLFGPIFRSELESVIFMSFLGSGMFFQLIFPLMLIIQLFNVLALSMLTFCLFRLFRTRLKVNRTLKKLTSILQSKQKARAVLFRLTDYEIYLFSKLQVSKILEYIEKAKKLRWKVIKLAYFSVPPFQKISS